VPIAHRDDDPSLNIPPEYASRSPPLLKNRFLILLLFLILIDLEMIPPLMMIDDENCFKKTARQSLLSSRKTILLFRSLQWLRSLFVPRTPSGIEPTDNPSLVSFLVPTKPITKRAQIKKWRLPSRSQMDRTPKPLEKDY